MSETTLAISREDMTTLENLMPTLPHQIESIQDAAATYLVCRDLGLPFMTSVGDLMVINGVVGMTSKLMLALILRAGHRCDVEMSSTESTATCYRKYDDEWTQVGKYTFTWDDAVTANLAPKDVYQQYPADMLANKAVARAARFAFPDVLRGYVPDEMEDITGIENPMGHAVHIMEEPMALADIVETLDAEIVEGDDPDDPVEAHAEEYGG
jgi:hypothetical protein